MAEPARVAVGDIALTRVEYFDIALDPASVSLTADQVAALPWAVPTWATPDGQVRIGQAMWVVESGGTTIVVDPCGASDAFLRSGPGAVGHQDAMLAALAAAGFARDAVDLVLLSHLDGIGLVAVVDEAGRWSPAFPSARVLVSTDHLAFLDTDRARDISGRDAFAAVQRAGVVEGFADGDEVAPGVVVQLTGAHIAGHAVIRVGAGDGQAVMVGHLAVSPLHAAAGPCEGLNDDPAAAWSALGGLVADAAAHDHVLVGPLWPYPGAGRVAVVDGAPTIVAIGS